MPFKQRTIQIFTIIKENIAYIAKRPNFVASNGVLFFDAFVAFISLFIAIYLRIGDDFLDYSPDFVLKNMMVLALISASIFSWAQINKTLWRYFALDDMIPISIAAVLANVIYFPLMILMAQQESFPKTVVLINMLVLIILLGGSRFLYRLTYEHNLQQNKLQNTQTSVPVLIIGLCNQTENFIKESLQSDEIPYYPVGIVAQKSSDVGRKIYGVTVMGEIANLDMALDKLRKRNNLPRQLIITQNQLTLEEKKAIAITAKAHSITLMHLIYHFDLSVVED